MSAAESLHLNWDYTFVPVWERVKHGSVRFLLASPIATTEHMRACQSAEAVRVQALSVAIAEHDRGTNTHARRVMQLTEATARRLGLSDEDICLFRLAALLHDIGKIGIPHAILHKPAPLNEEEWNIMRQHPEIGRRILEQAGGIFQPVATIVATHHERWDGHGYPLGIAREAIPLGARLVAVVDAYDAMTSRRVYREPLSLPEAKAELQRYAGSQFDPRIIETFLDVLEHSEHRQPCHR